PARSQEGPRPPLERGKPGRGGRAPRRLARGRGRGALPPRGDPNGSGGRDPRHATRPRACAPARGRPRRARGAPGGGRALPPSRDPEGGAATRPPPAPTGQGDRAPPPKDRARSHAGCADGALSPRPPLPHRLGGPSRPFV